MKLCWLQMFLFIFAPKLTDLKRPVWLPDHLDGNPCKDRFSDQWRSLNLDHTKRSLDHVCKCHVDRCVYIAVLPTFRQVPVYWAYRIHHEEPTVLLKQDFLRNIWTWYIPPKIIRDILQEKTSDSQRAVLRSSLPITHIVSGLVPAKKKHIINKSNCPRKDCIHWIAYNYTSSEGKTFDGAAIRDSYQWKQMSVIQLAAMLSKTYSSAKHLKKLSYIRKVCNHGLEIFPEKPAFANYKKPAVGKILHGEEERIFRGSENALEMHERKMYQLGLAAVEQEDTLQIEEDSKDRSERSLDFEVELTGEVLSISQDAAVPKESWLDSPEKMQKDVSEHDIFYREHDFKVSMTHLENGREQAKQILGMFRDSSSFQKTRPQQDIVPSSLEVIPDEKATEAPTVPLQTEFTQYDTLQTTESLTTTEATSTENLSRPPPMITDTEIQLEPSTMLSTVVPHTEDIDHSETTREPWLTPTTEVLDTESSTIREQQITDINENESTIKQKMHENERTTQQLATTSLVVAGQGTTERVQFTEYLQTGITEETSTHQQSTTNKVTQVSEPPHTFPTLDFETECTGNTMTSTTSDNKEYQNEFTKTKDNSETPISQTAEVLDKENTEQTVLTSTLMPKPSQSEVRVTEKTQGTQIPPNTTNKKEDCTEPSKSPETGKTTESTGTTTANVPEVTSDESFETECTEEAQTLPDTTNISENYTKPMASPEPEETTHVLETKASEETSPLGVHLNPTTNLPDLTTRGLETECTEENTSTANKREDQSETTTLKITKTVEVLGTEPTEETEPTLSLTPEPTSQRTDVAIPTTLIPEVTSAESFETECTEEAQTPPDTMNNNEKYAKPTASPEPEKTTHVLETKGIKETSLLGVHLDTTTNVPDLTTRGQETECSEETTLSATADKREEESETTAALQITTTNKVLGTEPMLSLTPEATSQRSDVTIPNTSAPEVTSAESFKTPSDTTNDNKIYTEPRTSPEPEKTTHVLETKITEKTFSIPVHLDTTMNLPDFTTKGLVTERTEETTETSSGDLSKWPCHGLIHHTPTASRRCKEKMQAWLKLQKTISRQSPTAVSDHPSTHSNFRSQEALQLTQVSDAVNHKNDISRKTGDQNHLKDEEDDHFYFFDGKLRIRHKFYVK